MGVAAKQADPGISGVEEFWIVVFGSLAAAAVLAVLGVLWKQFDRPVLKIEYGNGFDFDKRVGITDPMVAMAVENNEPQGAVAKFIRVSEVRGRSGASDVVISLRNVKPPAPHTSTLVELKWADWTEANAIRPRSHKYAVLQLLIFYTADLGTYAGRRVAPTIFEHADEVEFDLELIVGGKKYSEQRFRMKNPWSVEKLDALPTDKWPPPDIKWPTVWEA